ncbi:hypothetical protein [Rhizobium miluonense]|uniref:Uncharacterized protein n=1 Tax=Rhizobium miluonense TaxID=411945 RepID=A0ABU1SUG3_9HYPH|nr:hypothetical protein [Rhizobium miluonense]MDR6902037.1 hypothetical protein [Rhizobium miluonense]
MLRAFGTMERVGCAFLSSSGTPMGEINHRLTIITFICYSEYKDLIPKTVAQFADECDQDCRDLKDAFFKDDSFDNVGLYRGWLHHNRSGSPIDRRGNGYK